MRPRQIVSAYFLVQAVATTGWWTLLLAYPPSVKWFQPNDWPIGSLWSFWLADLVLIIAGSIIAAMCVLLQTAWAGWAVWTIAIVTWYPTLVCIAASLQTGQAWIASAWMVSMAGLSLAMATIHGSPWQSPATIRATPMNRPVALLWTLSQTALFWGTFLWVLPLGIVEIEQHLGWTRFRHPFQAAASAAMLLSASALGLWSGITMALRGEGTPLPTATAPRLVIAGPYHYVRNPMAVAGVMQGIAVGWALGSVSVISYSLAGAVLWHVAVRPVEERDLVERFGESYDEYRKHTGHLWKHIGNAKPLESQSKRSIPSHCTR